MRERHNSTAINFQTFCSLGHLHNIGDLRNNRKLNPGDFSQGSLFPFPPRCTCGNPIQLLVLSCLPEGCFPPVKALKGADVYVIPVVEELVDENGHPILDKNGDPIKAYVKKGHFRYHLPTLVSSTISPKPSSSRPPVRVLKLPEPSSVWDFLFCLYIMLFVFFDNLPKDLGSLILCFLEKDSPLNLNLNLKDSG